MLRYAIRDIATSPPGGKLCLGKVPRASEILSLSVSELPVSLSSQTVSLQCGIQFGCAANSRSTMAT